MLNREDLFSVIENIRLGNDNTSDALCTYKYLQNTIECMKTDLFRKFFSSELMDEELRRKLYLKGQMLLEVFGTLEIIKDSEKASKYVNNTFPEE